MKRTAFFLFLFAMFHDANAQSDTLALAPVEVRSVRAGQQAPFAKTDLSKATIEKQNFGQDLPFLFNFIPSVVVNSDAGNGVGYTGIRIRGTDATRINVTLNGIPFNDPESGGTFFVNLPDFLSSTNSIQVQRGVGSSSNGAGAFGGTINLSTNERNDQRYLELNNSFGSFLTRKNTLKFGTGLLGKKFTIEGRASSIASDGFIDRASSNLYSGYLSGAHYGTKTTLRLNLFTGSEKTYQAWYGIPASDLDSARTNNYAGTEKPGTPYDNETDNYDQSHVQFFVTHRFNSQWTVNTGLFYIRGAGYYEQYKADADYAAYNISSSIPTTDLVRRLWLDNDFVGDVFSLIYKKNKTGITVGGMLSQYRGNHFGKVIWAKDGLPSNRSDRYYDHDARKNDHSIYTKWEQDLGKGLQLYTDLQFRHTDHRISGFRNNPAINLHPSFDFLNPKAGISWTKNGWNAFASYSVAHKEPNRDDFEAGLTEQPKPEQLHDMELQLGKRTGTYSLSSTLYYMRYKDQLVLTGKVNDVGAYTRTNIPESYRAGIELEAGARFYSWLRAGANLTLSRNRVKNFTEFIDNYDDGTQKTNLYKETELSFSPHTTAAVVTTINPVKQLEFTLYSKYVSEQQLDNTGNKDRRLDAFYTQDLQGQYRFAKGIFKQVVLNLQVNNLFNRKYEPNGYTFSYIYGGAMTTENWFYPMAGRNYLVGLNLRF